MPSRRGRAADPPGRRDGLIGLVHAMLAEEHLKMLADDCLVPARDTGGPSSGAWRAGQRALPAASLAWLAIGPTPGWASTFPGGQFGTGLLAPNLSPPPPLSMALA
jgi:hypothetical protein